MKKLLLALAVLMGFGSVAFAGHFIDVLPPASATGCTPVSNGYDYNCSNDTTAPAMILKAPLNLLADTTAQIAALTPSTTGQLIVVTNPQTFNVGTYGLCISSGVAVGQWIAVSTLTAVSACK